MSFIAKSSGNGLDYQSFSTDCTLEVILVELSIVLFFSIMRELLSDLLVLFMLGLLVGVFSWLCCLAFILGTLFPVTYHSSCCLFVSQWLRYLISKEWERIAQAVSVSSVGQECRF